MTPKRFLFITPLTPTAMLTPMRQELYQCFLKALENQTYPHWTALLIGEEEKAEGNKIYLHCKGENKTEKLWFAYSYINSLKEKPDFLVRIDDDDIISPVILEKVCDLGFDCYADKYHSFYELTSGLMSQQKRAWLPNTIIHRMEHALQLFGNNKQPLFILDHSKEWHKYYENKKIKWARKSHPVYLRVVSPTSIMANYTSSSQVEENYKNYLKGFGKWKKKTLKDYEITSLPKM